MLRRSAEGCAQGCSWHHRVRERYSFFRSSEDMVFTISMSQLTDNLFKAGIFFFHGLPYPASTVVPSIAALMKRETVSTSDAVREGLSCFTHFPIKALT